MSQDDTRDLGTPQAGKVAPEAMTLRAQPRPVTRLNRRTLAVLVGKGWSRTLYTIFVLVPFAILAVISLLYTLGWLGFFTLIAALPAIVITLFGRTPRELIIALQLTSFSALGYAAFLGAALAWSPL